MYLFLSTIQVYDVIILLYLSSYRNVLYYKTTDLLCTRSQRLRSSQRYTRDQPFNRIQFLHRNAFVQTPHCFLYKKLCKWNIISAVVRPISLSNTNLYKRLNLKYVMPKRLNKNKLHCSLIHAFASQ